jgi:hypothetical protein
MKPVHSVTRYLFNIIEYNIISSVPGTCHIFPVGTSVGK